MTEMTFNSGIQFGFGLVCIVCINFLGNFINCNKQLRNFCNCLLLFLLSDRLIVHPYLFPWSKEKSREKMTEITFSLVRSQNPEISTAADIEEIDCIRLINCGIKEIDNLELFHHINELYLSNNQITSLENLSILFKLKILDVSYNNITSEGLRKSIARLPKSLISINLTGNPCVNDEEGLMALQDAIPEVIIAIDIENEEVEESSNNKRAGKLFDEKENESPSQRETENNENEENGDEEDSGVEKSSTPRFLSNEEVLKSIVERKCLIQNTTSSFKLDAAVQVSVM